MILGRSSAGSRGKREGRYTALHATRSENRKETVESQPEPG